MFLETPVLLKVLQVALETLEVLEIAAVSRKTTRYHLRQVTSHFNPRNVVYHAIHHQSQLLSSLGHRPNPGLQEPRLARRITAGERPEHTHKNGAMACHLVLSPGPWPQIVRSIGKTQGAHTGWRGYLRLL